METFDIVTVGHFAIDQIVTPGFSYMQMLGGSPTYVSLAAGKLGAHVGVISVIGEDFPEAYIKFLQKNNVDLFGVGMVENDVTTSFVLEYYNGKRILWLENLGPKILLEDVPDDFSAKNIHVAPIAGEIAPEVVNELRKRTNILSLDPQGFLREFSANGRTSLRNMLAPSVLEKIDVYKSSSEEIRVVTGLRSLEMAMKRIQEFGVKTVVVTMGAGGAAVLFDDTFCKVPAYMSKTIVDPTGAGDVFAGAFLAEYAKEKDVVWCACVGSAMASFKVETVGPYSLPKKEVVYERAQCLLAKCMSQKTHNKL
ncbi:MAG: carbohydrate kinase family protein [Candidatus Bathyarchaeales archaeon]